MANPFARLDNICLLLVGIHEGLGVPGKSHRHKMNSDSVSQIALLSYKTIMKTYRKQHIHFETGFTCAWLMQVIITYVHDSYVQFK
jgi:hypothetical protein